MMLSHIKVVVFGTHRLGPDEIGQVHPSAVQEDCELIWDDQHRSAKNFEKKMRIQDWISDIPHE